MIGKPNGVQAGTLRSRYTSLSFFIQFLRKQQIFAGMSRFDLSNIENAISDFSKELHLHIAQRKVEVRRNKAKHLLNPEQFFKYGKSKHIQSLMEIVNKKANSISKGLALQFRDYLIASLCIGNGLRASNIIIDFK